MGGKKKNGEKMGGQKKRPFFQKPKKWGISKKKKKKGEKMGRKKKNPFFQNPKNGETKKKKAQNGGDKKTAHF